MYNVINENHCTYAKCNGVFILKDTETAKNGPYIICMEMFMLHRGSDAIGAMAIFQCFSLLE